jgi:DivIVA domain-containing protein
METRMAITPQAIKDQEFKIKLRGYDTIEVNAYLELIADEFFEMFEQAGQQADYIDGLIAEKEELIDLRMRIEGDMATLQRKYDKALLDIEAANAKNATLLGEVEDMKSRIANLEWEGKEKDDLLNAATEALEGEKKEKEGALAKLASFEEQWGEQQKAEIDFRETLLAGQRFSRDTMKKSEEEAARILAEANAEAENLRLETERELARYPEEIEQLKAKRDRVREDLKSVLEMCLDNLDVFDTGAEEEDDCSDLFQKVILAEDGSGDIADLEEINTECDLQEALPADCEPEPEDERS